MKIVLTESQYKNILSHYLNKIVDSPEFSFVDHIEVDEGTTRNAKWTNTYESPFYEYIIYVNDYDERVDSLYDKIGDIHKILFPPKEDGSISAYYHINTKYI